MTEWAALTITKKVLATINMDPLITTEDILIVREESITAIQKIEIKATANAQKVMEQEVMAIAMAALAEAMETEAAIGT